MDDMKVVIDTHLVERVAELMKEITDVRPYGFCDESFGVGLFPPEGAGIAVDYFFASTLHQYGFWTDDARGYVEPYYGTVDGRSRKGAEFMFRAFMRKAEEDPAFLSPARQAGIAEEELLDAFRTDDGPCRLPMFDTHLELARAYGRDMLELGLSPLDLVNAANESDNPFETFVEFCDRLGGYKEDPLRKKTSLLLVILKNRPERFLRVADQELIPIVDYHIQRSFLRTGMVKICDAALGRKLEQRRFVLQDEEEELRRTVYGAVELLSSLSGKDIAAIDWFFFSFRKLCHEMKEPECSICQVRQVCRKHRTLFQPVFRTTCY